MSRQKPWSFEAPIKDGIARIRAENWDGFNQFVQGWIPISQPAYVWRGQRSDWKLTAGIFRLYPQYTPEKLGHLLGNKFLSEHLRAFQYASRGRKGIHSSAITTDNEWWALGQAHGLATPLLDWTASPYVAAYFAYCESDGADERRWLYGIHRSLLHSRWRTREVALLQAEVDEDMAAAEEQDRKEREQTITLTTNLFKTSRQIQAEAESQILDAEERERERKRARREANPFLEFVNPLTDDNARLVNQSGIFTRTPMGEDVERHIQETCSGEGDIPLLLRVSVPSAERELAMLALNRMNINHLTLFPDLHGATTFCNMSLAIRDYSSLGFQTMPPPD